MRVIGPRKPSVLAALRLERHMQVAKPVKVDGLQSVVPAINLVRPQVLWQPLDAGKTASGNGVPRVPRKQHHKRRKERISHG